MSHIFLPISSFEFLKRFSNSALKKAFRTVFEFAVSNKVQPGCKFWTK
jgi:hypothetical protein